LKVGIGWSTEFDRGWQRLWYRRLRYAYRAPSFFADLFLEKGYSINFVRFDESLLLRDLDGTSGRITENVDLLYIATHGESHNSGYRVALRDQDWAPFASSFGCSGPSVAVFDTCDLINLGDANWLGSWVSNVGSSLRLLLGFASLATFAHDSTRRGQRFAEMILAGDPIGPSWLKAVHSTSYPGLDVGIAVAFGDSSSDAKWALRELKLSDLPAKRGSSTLRVEIEYSR
jgi:hypothetical protein